MVYSLPFLTQSGEFPMAARSRRYFCHVLYFLVACASLAVAQGTYTQIDFPSALMSEATGINRAGPIVGIYADDIGGHGYLLHNGIYTTIDYPGAQYSYAQGINDKGQIVGLAEPIGYVFDMNEQSFTSIQYPGASFTYPVAINNAGAIAGYFQTPHMAYRGFELVNLDYTKVSPPTSVASFVNGITAEGETLLATPRSITATRISHSGKANLVQSLYPRPQLLLCSEPILRELPWSGTTRFSHESLASSTRIEFSKRFHFQGRLPLLPPVSMRTATS
jgi:hypothetical protein